MRVIITGLALLMISTMLSCKIGTTSEGKESTGTIKTENMKTMFVGTYTKKEGHVNGRADGIIALKFNSETGEILSQKTVAEVVNPSFVKTSPDRKFLFAVSELSSADAPNGYFYSFRILENNDLKQISRLSTEGFAPAHIALDQTGSYAFVSNYMGGVVMLYAIENDGSLKIQQQVDLENPSKSHAHSVTISADNRRAYVADLGNDKIWIFNFNAEEGSMTPGQQDHIDLEKGTGPRHFTIAVDGEFAYSVNELNNSVSVFKVQEDGGLELLQNISTLPKDFRGKNSAADIHLHPSGKFLYASNRGHNSIAAFNVDVSSGKLSALDQFSTKGETPRSFALSNSGHHLYVANQDSNSIVLFNINNNTGKLSSLGSPYEVMTPVSLEFK